MNASDRKTLDDRVIARAWADEKFRSRLIRDPKAVLKKEFDFDIPDHVELTIVAEETNHFYFVIPVPPERPVIPTISQFLPPVSSVSDFCCGTTRCTLGTRITYTFDCMGIVKLQDLAPDYNTAIFERPNPTQPSR